jgi:hypothetical protein
VLEARKTALLFNFPLDRFVQSLCWQNPRVSEQSFDNIVVVCAQIMLMSAHDKGMHHTHDLFQKLRSYAAEHARRGACTTLFFVVGAFRSDHFEFLELFAVCRIRPAERTLVP